MMKVNIISAGLLLVVCIYAAAAYPYSDGENEDTDLDEPLLNSRLLEELLSYRRGSNKQLEAAVSATMKDLAKNGNDMYIKTLLSSIAQGSAKTLIDKTSAGDVKAAAIAVSNYKPKK